MRDATPPHAHQDDPGYSRDEALERARGAGRPAEADLQPHRRDDDPNPDRHIHFSPAPPDEA